MDMNTATERLLSDPGAPPPNPPAGFEACRTGWNPQMTHLVALDRAGRNGGRPTVCGLTRFDKLDVTTGQVLRRADLRGWGLGGGVAGPGVVQERCAGCWTQVEATTDITAHDAVSLTCSDATERQVVAMIGEHFPGVDAPGAQAGRS